MTKIGGSQALYKALKQVKDDLNAAFIPTVDRARSILLQSASSDDTIDPRRADDVQANIGTMVQRLFVGENLRSPFATDGFTPMAVYPQILNYWLVWVQAEVVKAHETYMRRALKNHPDILRWLESAQVRELTFTPSQRQNAEERLRRLGVSFDPNASDDAIGTLLKSSVFRPNPLATYEPAHTWIAPNGYRLSDRIWETSVRTRTQIDKLLADGIREGRAARDIASDLEQSLLPNRQLVRTNKPYGNASFDAMRLARTEISRAHAQATLAAAKANPFVTGLQWRLSSRHPRVDICDSIATIGMSGEQLREPYPLDSAPLVVVDSHPQCICVNFPAVEGSITDVIAMMRGEMQRGAPPPPTPLNALGFLRRMVGDVLSRIAATFSL